MAEKQLPRPWRNEPDRLSIKPKKGDRVLAWIGDEWAEYVVVSGNLSLTMTIERHIKGRPERRSLKWTKLRKPFK